MNNKINIEEIKYMLPDYITGSLNESGRQDVEKAIAEIPEIKEFYNEMKSTFEFVDGTGQEEPAPQYWNSLLPRIHERIEQQPKGFSWEKLSAYWKIFVPVAAVILIAVIYLSLRPVENQLTDDKKTEQLQKDTKKDPVHGENNIQEENKQQLTGQDKNIIKEGPAPLVVKRKNRDQVENPAAKNEQQKEMIKEEFRDIPKDENLAADVDETSIFASGEAAGIDEETENELKKLDETERSKLLEELLNSNL